MTCSSCQHSLSALPRLFSRSSVTYSRLQVDQDRARDISRVVALVVKHILAVPALGGKVLEVAILADSVLLAELLPELASNCLPRQQCLGQLPRPRQMPRPPAVSARGVADRRAVRETSYSLLLPHCPAWIVIISLCMSSDDLPLKAQAM